MLKKKRFVFTSRALQTPTELDDGIRFIAFGERQMF